MKKTGSGIANSTFALHHYTRPRTVVIDKNSKADAWWFPMDGVLEELGNRLAEAQIGNVLAAVKVPLLIAQRQAAVLKFARMSAKVTQLPRAEEPTPRLFASLRVKARSALGKLSVQLQPPLSTAEKSLGRAAMSAVFTGVATSPLKPMPRHEAEDAVDEVYEALPFPANVGFRASLWTVGLAPMVMRREWATLDKLTIEEQVKILAGFAKGDSYILRQVALLIKTTGALSHASTTRFHAAVPSVRG